MARVTIDNVILDEEEDRVFSDMASILNKYPTYKVRTESGFRSVFTRFGYRKMSKFAIQKEVARSFTAYAKRFKLKYYEGLIKEAEFILKKHGA